MTSNVSEIDIKKSHKAGMSQSFSGGKLTFLSPLPLPTGMQPTDHSHTIGDLKDQYLDFGVGFPSVFGWQVTLGIPFGFFLISALLFPTAAFILLYMVGNGLPDAIHAFRGMMDLSFLVGLWGGGGLLLWWLVASGIELDKRAKIIPTRFNRQRREVCFVPEGQSKPVFIPWEQLVAWIVEAQGVTQYGVQRQYGFGVGFYHPDNGEKFTLEFQSFGLSLALSNWEAIRAYMEYEVDTLQEVQDPLDLQGSNDPPWEGMHTFINLRNRTRCRRQAGEIGRVYIFFWHVWQILNLWSIPYRLVDWEVKKIKTMNHKALPETMKQWSEPLLESEWAKPSGELTRQSERVRAKQKANPRKPVTEIFAEVSGEGQIIA